MFANAAAPHLANAPNCRFHAQTPKKCRDSKPRTAHYICVVLPKLPPPRYKHHGKNRTRVFGLRACRMSHAKNSSRRLFTVSAKSAIYRNIPQHTAPLTAPLKPPFPRRKHAREIAKPPKLKPAVNAPKKASVRLCTAFSVSQRMLAPSHSQKQRT